MKKYYQLIAATLCLVTVILIAVSCEKDVKTSVAAPAPPTSPIPNGSFVEEFDQVNDLPNKGWVFKNNSNPIGVTGWRQGRFEASDMAQNKKFLAPVPYVGFPAYSAHNTPNDFVSCDITAASDAASSTYSGTYNAWLVSPAVPMKNGDKIIFYTRALDDSKYPVYVKDRMQVRANFTDGTANVGVDTVPGKFTKILLDINPNYHENDPAAGTGGGYPRVWTKYTITLSGLPAAGISAGRFAFRYLAFDAGLYGGPSQSNYPSVVGVDSLAFVHN
jgi:hypothetical protein